jgi:hypothetical protein
MKKQLFLLALVLMCMTLPVYAQWGWLGDMLDEAVNEAYGDSSSSGSSGSSSSYSSSTLRSGSYYTTAANGVQLQMDLSLENQSFQLYGNGNYAGRGIAVIVGNILTVQFTGDYAGVTDSFTITGGNSFVGNADGLKWNRR